MRTPIYIVLSIVLALTSLFYSRNIAMIEPLKNSRCFEMAFPNPCKQIMVASGFPLPFFFKERRNVSQFGYIQLQSLFLTIGFYWILLFISQKILVLFIGSYYSKKQQIVLKNERVKMIKVLMLCFLLALIFSIASSFLEKGLGVGEVYLSLEACMGKEMHWSCFHPVTSGGFPFAYIFDSLGRTMIGSIDLVDDPFRLLPFLVNIWIYFLLFIAIFSSIRMRKNNKKV